MSSSYEDAVRTILNAADTLVPKDAWNEEHIPIHSAIGRTVTKDYNAPFSTPQHTTSAFDGYAVYSAYTKNATAEHPIILRVVGRSNAGDAELLVTNERFNNTIPCVEIMTGAIFPKSTTTWPFDAVIPLERTVSLTGVGDEQQQLLRLQVPARANQHRRLAGEDLQQDEPILAAGCVVQEQHIMALASVGHGEIAVRRKPRIGIWSTGTELQHRLETTDMRIKDINAPFLLAVLRARGADVCFLGTLNDDFQEVASSIQHAVDSSLYDILISTGGVSVGKMDFIPIALKGLNFNILFHGVSMRPGHPVLFATIARKQAGIEHSTTGPTKECMGDSIAFFGLPGNPIATAVTFEFLVMPYLSRYGIEKSRMVKSATLIDPAGQLDGPLNSRWHNDQFRHGILQNEHGRWICWASEDQSPAKLRPLLKSNCWIHLRKGDTIGAKVVCYSLYDSAA